MGTCISKQTKSFHVNRVILGTNNQEKTKSIIKMLKKYNFTYNEFIQSDVNSNVDESPINNETCEGASNRIENLIAKFEPKQNDLYVALESGLFELYEKYKWYERCICCIKWFGDLSNPLKIVSGSEDFPLCDYLNNVLSNGDKHRVGMKKIRENKNIPQNIKDTFFIYTDGEKSRSDSFEQSFGNCLLRLKNN